MDKPNILSEIKERILASENGSVFVSADFSDITDNAKVGVCLSRLEVDGTVRRIMRGVYEKSECNSSIAPLPDKVAHALAKNYGWTIVPCGDTALHLLGLHIQSPNVWIYASDGTYKEYTYDDVTIKFKRTTNRETTKLSYKTALVIQAVKAFGKENIDSNIIYKIGKTLTTVEKEKMLSEARFATSWVYEHIKKICEKT